MEEGFTQLQILFGEYYECDKLVYQLFKKNINRFKDTNKRWSKLNSGKKTEYYNFFSPSNWQKLSNNEKVKHTKFCNECTITNAYYQALFPSISIRYTNARKENVVRVLNNIKGQPKKSALKEHTSRIYNTINTEFKNKFGVPFSEGLINMPELNLQLKPSSCEMKKEKRALTKKVKTSLQKEMDQTAVDRCFGTRQSLKKWDMLRTIQSFETVTDAINRTKENEKKVLAGEKNKKIMLVHVFFYYKQLSC